MNIPGALEMWFDGLCAADLAQLLREEYIRSLYLTNFIPSPSRAGDPANPSEQFANAPALASLPQYLNQFPSSHVSLITPADYSYGTRTAELGYQGPEVDFPLHQHTTQPLPVSYLHNEIHHHVAGGITENDPPPCSDPYRAEGYPASSSATLNSDHEPISPKIPGLNRGYPLFVESFQPSDNTAWASPTVARDEGAGDPPVFSPPGRVENGGAIRLPKGSPPSVTHNVAPCNPKKRKRQDSQDDPRKGKRSRSQHHDQQIGRSIQSTPSSPPRPSELRILVRQKKYEVPNKQKWDKLDDIVFTVRGRDGIELPQAMDTYFNGPDDRDLLMFTNGEVGSSISCRINFEDYETNGKAEQIPTSNYKEGKGRITKKRLAEYTAKRIKAYLEKLGLAGTPYPVRFEDMILTRLIHVSKGSFQPEIWYQITPPSSTNA
ncbi:hypothetical protein BJ322DRAFT_1108780 [Thelephora terrestris]|uniref:Uncharacterized protein n=1 Tax=Thelephora terrestris TaxID=56493 RepID=A0A9P6HFX5_9AGAM|nr:hypothetical protein BJ322DRAFT_1108780 [Thelephora terrestris]